ALLLLGREPKVLGLVELLTNPRYKVTVLLVIAEHFAHQGTRQVEAAEIFLRAENAAHAIEDNYQRAEALRELAKALAQAGEVQRAERMWRQAQKAVERWEVELTIDERVFVLSELAIALVKAEQWQQANSICADAEQVAGSIEDSYRRATVLRELAKALVQ